MTAATDTVEVQNLVFSRWIEVKHKAEPHNYIEFFLVTDTGNEVLAISAEDHGNSHYVYHSTGAFAKYGTLNSKNRADTISWLEMIIKDSQIKVDSQLAAEVAHAGKPTPDNPLGLYYTQHKVEKTANPDGTHTQRFFLLDQYGNWHLAVMGEERETRDGHYLYRATEEFSARYPLSCHAQKDVIHWLEQRVTHNLPSSLAPHHRNDRSGSVGTSVGVTGAAVSGPAASVPSGTSADAWGSGCPGLGAGGGYTTAATPTSGCDGPVGSDGSGPIPRVNHQPTPQQEQQQQQQVSGSVGSPVVDGAVSDHPLVKQQPQQETLGVACLGMQGDEVTQDAGEPPMAAIQPVPGTTPASSLTHALPPQHLPNCVGALGAQGNQRQTGGQAPTATFSPQQQQQQQQLVNSGAQHSGTGPFQQQHSNHQLPGDSPCHIVAAGQASGSVSPLASLQQLQLEAAVPQQHEAAAAPTALPSQQGMQAQSSSTPQQQHFVLTGTPLHQQGTQGSEPVLPAESPGLAQLLAGLAASMPGGGAPSPLPNNCPPLQLQLPLPPQLQLQGSHMGPPMASPLQPPNLQTSSQLHSLQQFMAPSLFHQPPPQQQQQQLPFPALDPQTQLQQQQQLQLLQQQLQQRQQELQQLLQSNAAALAANNAAVGQQLSVPGGPLPLPSSALSPEVQAWNQGNASVGNNGMSPLPLEQSATLAPSAQAGLGAAAVQVPAPSKVGSEVNGDRIGVNARQAGFPRGMLTSLYLPPSDNMFTPHPHPYPQQPPLQLLGQADGVVGTPGGHLGASIAGGVYGGVDALSGGGVTPLAVPPGASSNPVGFSNATPAAAVQPPSPMGLYSVYGTGSADGVSPGPPSSSGLPPQPVGPAAGQLMAPGSLPLGLRGNKDAGPCPTPGSGHHHGGRGGGRGSSGKHKLAGVAEVAHKRKLARLAAAGEEAVRLAQGAYLAGLRHQALSEAAQQEALRKTIASWVRGQISDDEVSVNGWHENLEQILHEANRTRTLSVPFLSNESLMEVTRSSVEAITLAAAMSLTAPYDPMAASSAAPPPVAPQQLPLLRPAPNPVHIVAAVGMAAAQPPVSLPDDGGGGECRAATDADQPSTTVVCHAEALAAVSSLKALLMGDLQAAVQGPAAHARTPAPTHVSQVPAASGLDIINNETHGGTILTDVESKTGGAGQAGVSTVAGFPAGLQSTVSETNGPAGLAPTACTANACSAAPGINPGQSGQPSATAAAAAPAPAHAVSAATPPPQQPFAISPLVVPEAETEGTGLCPPPGQPVSTFPEAPGPPSVPNLPPLASQTPQQPPPPLTLPVVPMRPTGPVGSTTVLACAGTAKTWSFSDPHMNKHGVRIALESLRELAALCPPVANMASSNLVDTVRRFEAHPHPSVSGLAKEILKRWRGSFIHRLRCMSDSRCYQDPVAALESKIQANEIVFPSINELLGVPRGSGAAATAADGAATPMTAAIASAAPASGLFYTPKTPAPTGIGNGFTAGSMSYPLPTTAAPLTTTTTGEAISLTGLPTTPLSFGAPALVPAAATTATGGTSAGGITPTGGLAATTAPETPRGLFDPSLTRVSALVVTPQLFGRHGGPAASRGLTSSGLATTEVPAPFLQSPAAAPSPLSPAAALPPLAVAATEVQFPGTLAAAEAATQAQAAPPRSPPRRQSHASTPGPGKLPMSSPRAQLMPPPPASPAGAAAVATTAPRQKMLLRPGAVLATAQMSAAIVTQSPAAAAVPPSSARIPQPPPPSNSSSAAGSVALPVFALPSHLLSASPLVAEATTADVAALLATSAQSLAVHMQTSVAAAASGGGADSSLSPSISPAHLSQLVTLASTAQVYASALKASDAAGAASAWQSLVQQLRQAQALSLGHGSNTLGGKLLQWPLSMPSQLSSTVTGVMSAAPPQEPKPPQIQPLQSPAFAQAPVPITVAAAAASAKAAPTAPTAAPTAAGKTPASSAPLAAGEPPSQVAATQPPAAALAVAAIGLDPVGGVDAAAGGEVFSGRSEAEGAAVGAPLFCRAGGGTSDV